MKEVGIPLEGQYPKIHTKEMADKVTSSLRWAISTGAPTPRRRRRGTGALEDPYGKSIEKYGEVRDEINRRIIKLIKDLKAGKNRKKIIGAGKKFFVIE